ncbi:cyclase/dehydrase [Mycobacterium tuberculosis]|nr:cyclase/dehydrase [Mycobacterium tuberculosis]
MVWDAAKTAQQHGQHGEYNLRREDNDKTRVRFTLTVEPSAPLGVVSFAEGEAHQVVPHIGLL